jgi:hypothetical protein
MMLLKNLTDSLLKAGTYNRGVQAAPAAILWTDKEGIWAPAIPAVQRVIPSLFVLGPYEVKKQQGPAIWIKCAVAGKVPELSIQDNTIPIVYLSGVSRSDLRAIESCPRHLQPLAELQYRGVFWSQANAKDWTVNAFLCSKHGGLGLPVLQDQATQAALLRALATGELLPRAVAELKNKTLDATFFDALIAPNPVKDILTWMNDPQGKQQEWKGGRWDIFVDRCRKDYKFHPEQDGELVAAEKLAAHSGVWAEIWEFYSDAYGRFPNVMALLERTTPPATLFEDVSGYPKANAGKEEELRANLLKLTALPPDKARESLLAEEHHHAERRDWLWSRMGVAPLANALQPLTVMARLVERIPHGNNLDAIAASYRDDLWQIDLAALDALAAVQAKQDLLAVQSALRAVYVPWLEKAAFRFQEVVQKLGSSGAGIAEPENHYQAGQCIVFVDGLRYDVATRLCRFLENLDVEVRLEVAWTTVPSVTASGKAWVSPVARKIKGKATSTDFEASIAESDKPLSAYNFRKLMEDNDWDILSSHQTGDPKGKAWTECGDLDHYGHEHGLKLARDLANQLSAIVERIEELLDAGWKHIRIVTDHGWLLVPGGMPKVELQKFETESRWGRCAVLKDNSQGTPLSCNWSWCPEVAVAMAPGIGSFVAGCEYGHGGLSLQESLIPVIDIQTKAPSISSQSVEIKTVHWQGLRCRIEITPPFSDVKVDIRTKAALADSSVVSTPKPCLEGHVSLVLDADRDDMIGTTASIVILGQAGQVLKKAATTIGGE